MEKQSSAWSSSRYMLVKVLDFVLDDFRNNVELPPNSYLVEPQIITAPQEFRVNLSQNMERVNIKNMQLSKNEIPERKNKNNIIIDQHSSVGAPRNEP